jgi:hypothetical protein
MRFPNGVPAMSDESMSKWMEYVYMQFPAPADAVGVEVKLEVVKDPNGNWYDIGTTTSGMTGYYSIDWKPPVPGHYLILASFAGSESYYPSYAEISIVVDPALTPLTPIEPQPPYIPPGPEEPEEPVIPPEEPEEPEEPEVPTEPEEPEEPTEPEQPTEAPLITTEVAIVALVAIASIIGVAAYWLLKRK